MLHFKNSLVHVALELGGKFNFMQFQVLKQRTQSVQLYWICTIFRDNQTQLLWEITWCIHAYLIHHMN